MGGGWYRGGSWGKGRPRLTRHLAAWIELHVPKFTVLGRIFVVCSVALLSHLLLLYICMYIPYVYVCTFAYTRLYVQIDKSMNIHRHMDMYIYICESIHGHINTY